MTAWTDTSTAVQDLTWVGLDHAVSSLEGGGPLTPFALLQRGEQRGLVRFAAERLEDGLARGRAHLAALPPEEADAAVLVYDGYVTQDGVRTDALWVEVHERGRPAAGRLVQAYVPTAGDAELLGSPADTGDCEPLLGGPGGASRRRSPFRRR